jgi:hypothetical protein
VVNSEVFFDDGSINGTESDNDRHVGSYRIAAVTPATGSR